MGNANKRTIFHIDVNSAYLAWEAVTRKNEAIAAGQNESEIKDLRDIPSIVGGEPEERRGIVLSKSFPCKPYKIQTGESLYSALKKCPQLVIIPARFKLYEEFSYNLIKYLEKFSDRVQQYSIDEAFIDYTYMEEHFGPPMTAAEHIRKGIEKELGYTVCIGVSSNKLLAKMATELRKPNFTNSLYPEEIEKMWALPIEELFMAGRATAPKLRNFGIQTIGDLARFDPKYLLPHFKSFTHLLCQYANGIDDSEVYTSHDPAKSIGNSTTIAYDVKNYEEANRILLSLCESVCKRLRENKFMATVINVGVRSNNLEFYSHQRKISNPTNSTSEIYKHARELFKEGWRRNPVRLLAVRASGLCGNQPKQLTLFGQRLADKQSKADRAIDTIRSRFGDEAVMRASYLCRNKKESHDLDKFSPFKSAALL